MSRVTRRSVLIGSALGLTVSAIGPAMPTLGITRGSQKPYGSITAHCGVTYELIYRSGAPVGIELQGGTISYTGGYVGEFDCGFTVHRGVDWAGFVLLQDGENGDHAAFSGSTTGTPHCVRSYSRQNSSGWDIYSQYRDGRYYSYRDLAMAFIVRYPNANPGSCNLNFSPTLAYQFDRNRWLSRSTRSLWLVV